MGVDTIKKKGRPQRTWGNNIRRAMSDRALAEEQALSREECGDWIWRSEGDEERFEIDKYVMKNFTS